MGYGAGALWDWLDWSIAERIPDNSLRAWNALLWKRSGYSKAHHDYAFLQVVCDINHPDWFTRSNQWWIFSTNKRAGWTRFILSSTLMHVVQLVRQSGGQLNINIPSYQYKKSCYEDQLVKRPYCVVHLGVRDKRRVSEIDLSHPRHETAFLWGGASSGIVLSSIRRRYRSTTSRCDAC